MPYEFYKVLHVTGIVAVFMGLGAMLLAAMSGLGARFPNRRWVMIFHGIGMAVVFISGFGLMARLGLMGAWPAWIYGKVFIWLCAGGISALILRLPKASRSMWFAVLSLVAIAAILAVNKPG